MAQAWGSTPYQSLDAPDIDLLTPPSVSLSEKQADLLANVNGRFVENLGQVGPGAGMFYAPGDPLSVALGPGWASYYHAGDGTGEGVMVRMDLMGANKVEPIGVDPLSYPTNFLKGNDPDKWVVGARSYREVHFREVYDGIDMVYRFDEGMLKYDFLVSPQADISQVKMGYSGHERLVVDSVTGDLVIGTPVVDLVDRAPVSYQDDTDGSDEISSRFILVDERMVSFEVKGHDPGLPLVIDPTLVVFSTYIGANKLDNLRDMLIDEGDVILTGWTKSTNFPTTHGVVQPNNNTPWDSFVLKLKADGSDLVFSTYIGGSRDDIFDEMVFDTDKNLILVGGTYSPDYPTTPGAIKTAHGSSLDGVVTKLNKNGSKIIMSTLIGGSKNDTIHSVAIMSNWDIILGGVTQSIDFPGTNGSYDDNLSGPNDSYIARIDANGTRIISATYVGGSKGDDQLLTLIAVDDNDDVYCMFHTNSTDLVTSLDAFSENFSGGVDGVVLKIDGNLTEMEYLTYIGGSGDDIFIPILIDGSGSVYLAGTTSSIDFPTTPDAYDKSHNGLGDYDAFISKLNPEGTNLSFSTFIGGEDDDHLYDFSLGPDGLIYLGLFTYTSTLPTTKHTKHTEY
ncbi:MAG: hypothetical protein KAQ96_11470, partial [Thermoplasmata archaeon]|nr:hypothetical protein [Thermoplasmata archaeon]